MAAPSRANHYSSPTSALHYVDSMAGSSRATLFSSPPSSGMNHTTNANEVVKFPWEEKKLSDLVTSSSLRYDNTQQQLVKVIEAFNQRSLVAYQTLDATITTSICRGSRIPVGKFRFFQRNQIPCVAMDEGNKVATILTFSPAISISEVTEVANDEKHIEVVGSHIINVPVGFYCIISQGTFQKYLLLDEGPHVFHDNTLKVESFVKKGEQIITFGGTTTILRIPPAKIVKVWYGSEAFILNHRLEPYVIVSPLFRLKETNTSQIFEGADQYLISHGTEHRVRVPQGFIARIWYNQTPLLLEPNSEPYIFHTPYFKTDPDNFSDSNAFLVAATTPQITLGSCKRIMPKTGEVCVCYNAGKLHIVEPSVDGKPFFIDSPSFEINGFLNTNYQTLVFPSESTKTNRRREKKADEEIDYEIFLTRDSLKMGIKILLVYQIKNPSITLMKFKREDIEMHLENICNVDVGRVMQKCSSQEFLGSSSNKPRSRLMQTDLLGQSPSSLDQQSPLSGSGPHPLQHFIDDVKNALADDLKECGIELIRLNIESPKILDDKICKQLENQSLLTAQSNAKESMLAQQYLIAKTEAEQQAKVEAISQEQKNKNLVNAAEAENKAADLKGKALITLAEAESKANQLRAAQYKEYASLLQIELAKIQAEAIRGCKVNYVVSSEEFKQGLGGLLMLGNKLS